jgi:serine/threonine protein kinase
MMRRGGETVMERATFLRHYRVRLNADGTPYELSPPQAGPVTSYEAIDERSGEPVSLTLIPAATIDPAAWEQFEQQMSSAQKLRHINIAKVLDFGREGDDFVYVAERLPGETLASWVSNRGPMSADPALRVAEQIVSVLSWANFHKLPYPSIQPSGIMIVPGQTPEGTWPLVKLTHFGVPALGSEVFRTRTPSSAAVQSNHADTCESTNSAESQQHGDLEPSPDGMNDTRAAVYSLGATLYFLLTGAVLPAEPLAPPPNLSRFPKPLRALLAQMLHPDANQRPKDLIVLAESIRECLSKMERRRALADKYGVPLRTTISRPAEERRGRLLPRALAAAALLLAAAVIAAVLLPEPIGRLVRRAHGPQTIGTLVGVPESLAPASVTSAVSPTTGPATAAVTAAPVANQLPATASDSPQPASSSAPQTQISNAQVQAVVPNASEAVSPGTGWEGNASSAGATRSSAKAGKAAQSATASESGVRGKKKRVVTASSRQARTRRIWAEGRAGSTRSRLVGITSDGRLILRLPSGRIAIVAPDADEDRFPPRTRRRVIIEREEMFAPTPPFGPDYFP